MALPRIAILVDVDGTIAGPYNGDQVRAIRPTAFEALDLLARGTLEPREHKRHTVGAFASHRAEESVARVHGGGSFPWPSGQ